MAVFENQLVRKIILIIILAWSMISFWYLSRVAITNYIVSFLALVTLISIIWDFYTLFIVVFLGFVSSYALYGYFFSLNLPIWVIMLAIFIVFGYLFLYLENKSEILKDLKYIYFFIFGLIILETFLFLSYFLISPINRSLIISSIVYIISGYCFWVLGQKNMKNFSAYIYISLIAICSVLVSARWG